MQHGPFVDDLYTYYVHIFKNQNMVSFHGYAI